MTIGLRLGPRWIREPSLSSRNPPPTGFLASQPPCQQGQNDRENHLSARKHDHPPRKALNPAGALPQQEGLNGEHDLTLRHGRGGFGSRAVFLEAFVGSFKRGLEEVMDEL